jgi:uncharacterized oligopeptide transporter (OPT) family protein
MIHMVPTFGQVPIFGEKASECWLWNLDSSLGYIGLGIITGPAVAFGMIVGAGYGWGALSWLSRTNGWAPGPIRDWETGVQGWILWPSLAALLVDCLINFCWRIAQLWRGTVQQAASNTCTQLGSSTSHESSPAASIESTPSETISNGPDFDHVAQRSEQRQALVPTTIAPWCINVCLALSVLLCTILVKTTIGSSMPGCAILIATVLALPLSLLGIQAVGETGANMVSAFGKSSTTGLKTMRMAGTDTLQGKISQYMFAAVFTRSYPHALQVNLIAGAIAEAGACQAPDLMGDLKVGHLLSLSPDLLFAAQLIGSTWGSIVAPFFYKLLMYTKTRKSFLNSDQEASFRLPAAHIWLVAGKLALGKGFPEKALPVSVATGLVVAPISILKNLRHDLSFLPAGASFAIGELNRLSVIAQLARYSC